MNSKFNKFKVIHRFTLLHIWMCIVFFHHVPPKMSGSFAREVTQTTAVGLFSSVLALVLVKNTSTSRRIVALVALERLFPSVLALVFFQAISCNATIVAMTTAVGLFFSVLALVYFQISSLSA